MNRKKVLICDDDEDILELMKIMLEDSGYDVSTSTSGKGIQEQSKKFRPDVLILDLWMPEVDGKDVTHLLKANRETKNIPIVVVSALTNCEKMAKEIGADDFLPKPFNMEDLIKKVKKHTN